MGRAGRMPVEFIDAGDKEQIEALARKHGVDLIHNAVDPVFNEAIFDAAYEVGCNYMDMAMTLSTPHATDPYNDLRRQAGRLPVRAGRRLGEERACWLLWAWASSPAWPTCSPSTPRSTSSTRSRRSASATAPTWRCAATSSLPNFSIWTTIEECLNPPVVWEEGKGWCTTEPFSEPEVFDFPEGIGPVECVNVEHEEVLLVPRWVKCKRVTFKYGLGDEFIGVLKTIKMLGLDNRFPIDVKGVQVAPRDVVAATLPDPAHLGDQMFGKTCAGTWVKGTKDGKPRQVYLYQVADNETCMKKYGVQAVVWQTAVNPVIAWELLADRGLEGHGGARPGGVRSRSVRRD